MVKRQTKRGDTNQTAAQIVGEATSFVRQLDIPDEHRSRRVKRGDAEKFVAAVTESVDTESVDTESVETTT